MTATTATTDAAYEQLAQRYAELEQDKAELAEILDRTETERDALEAHVAIAECAIDEWGDYRLTTREAGLRLADWAHSGPATSLARRDGRLADAIERASQDRAETEDCPRYEAGLKTAALMVRHWHKEGS